ncbi:Catechol 2,3-dioxygenase [Rhodococcus triatomae]|uniref:Catechol 2,3-dioxygenase n=1 Tax=Rhodococcus triatomae TaxID=300028 RepID=A0A1G8GA50_9NOCA|nr:Catechol 2,3-dioxygenase [Rhodococcus triatomae]
MTSSNVTTPSEPVPAPAPPTVTGVNESTPHRIGVAVPDVDRAVEFFASIVGDSPVRAAADLVRTVAFAPNTDVTLIPVAPDAAFGSPPRVVDVGTNHLCFRVGDIDVAAAYLAEQPGVRVLGDIVTVPDGPIRGNRWIYFRSPWGTLFELQQWPKHPAYQADTSARLFHGQSPADDARLPSLLGLDHTGYSVRDLEATIRYLVDRHGATEVLRTRIDAGRDFMSAQFGIDVEGTSTMAMLVVDDALNIELFEHSVGAQDPPRPPRAPGGNVLALHAQDCAPESAVETEFGIVVGTEFGR